MDTFLHSKTFKIVFYTIGIIAVVLVIFRAGMIVGYHQAEFSFRWGDNYYRNFVGPRPTMMVRLMPGKDFLDPHGAAGQIIKINDNSFVIKGADGVEKTIIVSNDTSIRRLRDNIKISNLQLNDFAVVIGEPNNSGQIGARLIRVLPSPFFNATSTQW